MNNKGFIIIWVFVALIGAELVTLLTIHHAVKVAEKNQDDSYIEWSNKSIEWSH